MYLVDSDVIDVLRGYPPALKWFGDLKVLPGIPGFVVMELLSGCDDKRKAREVDRLVAPLAVVWPSVPDCERALADFRNYHLSDGLGMLDALIAECAIGIGAVLYTFNAKHLRVVPGLVAEAPYSRTAKAGRSAASP